MPIVVLPDDGDDSIPASPVPKEDAQDTYASPDQKSSLDGSLSLFSSKQPHAGNYSVDYGDLSVDPLTYPVDQVPWPPGTPAPYAFLVHGLVTLSGTKSRIIILNVLTNVLCTLLRHHTDSVLPALYLLSNTLTPPYSPLELGLGGSIISKAIQHVSGLTPAALKKLYVKSGDPGDVAFEAKSNVRTLVAHKPLLITGVYDSLLMIAHTKGEGATKRKQSIAEKLLVSAKGEESRYLVRTLCLNLRVGAVRLSILTALARAVVLTPPSDVADSTESLYFDSSLVSSDVTSAAQKGKKKDNPVREQLVAKWNYAEALIRRIYVQHPNYDHIVEGINSGGLNGLAGRVPLTIGIPLHPTLGSPTRSLDEIYERLNNQPFTAEFKYDGQRAQIHGKRMANGQIDVKIFSRHLEDMTSKYPDVVSLVYDIFSRSEHLSSFITDSEIVAIEPKTGVLRSFQELSNRARKDVTLGDIKISVCVYLFDLMYLNDKPFLEHPFRERRERLRECFPPFVPEDSRFARLDHVDSCESTTGREAIEEFWQRAVESSSEGLMIKLLDNTEVEATDGAEKEKGRKKPLPATYEPDKRTSAWLKLKKDYVESVGDSLDLVPVGAWYGNGRKAGWWSPILLAVRDAESGRLVALCKCMSGFSDAFYKSMKAEYAEDTENCSPVPRWESEMGGFRPDMYFRPIHVWEVRGADITISPVSVASLGSASATRGLSLRFPRFIRVRDDKAIEDATSTEQLTELWRGQQRRGKGKDGEGVDDGDLVDVVMPESDMGSEEDD
ncbi:DNA ligase [Coniophora puteana RWD-64-598 SS2]|uniref:DNA ligase n=1 Tax=Coniophora puteana (strain RWD-64-598) TaxID=741705 RepID=A0A5M3MVG1_CONPW|nr:DNA ligase [Coniophora puteana RWD-64-598 SS2]EIW83139.1 DNA ligase [Coniophora puteana RWD-64-598 SS2]